MTRHFSLSLLLVSAGFAMGCGAELSMFEPAGPGASSLAGLGAFVIATFSVVAILMFGLIGAGALRRRGTLEEHLPYDIGGGQVWIAVGGFLIPVIILATVFIVTVANIDEFPLHDADTHRGGDIKVVGHQWWWEVEYVGASPQARIKTANEIHIPVGQPVQIELETADVIHSFWIPRLHGKVDLIPGRTNYIQLQADRPGVYLGECAEFCGAQHARMRLVLVAESPVEFAEWIERQKRPATKPADERAQRGKELFEQRACALCHTVRGTAARGTVGPDLTHLMSRRGLGAGSIPNKQAWLTAWTTRAQHFKPEARMPNVTDFTGEELNDLVHYLLQLH